MLSHDKTKECNDWWAFWYRIKFVQFFRGLNYIEIPLDPYTIMSSRTNHTYNLPYFSALQWIQQFKCVIHVWFSHNLHEVNHPPNYDKLYDFDNLIENIYDVGSIAYIYISTYLQKLDKHPWLSLGNLIYLKVGYLPIEYLMYVARI